LLTGCNTVYLSSLSVLQRWLETEGSPMSHIERAEFWDEHELEELTYDTFEKRRS
jgi:hypothetical protein